MYYCEYIQTEGMNGRPGNEAIVSPHALLQATKRWTGDQASCEPVVRWTGDQASCEPVVRWTGDQASCELVVRWTGDQASCEPVVIQNSKIAAGQERSFGCAFCFT